MFTLNSATSLRGRAIIESVTLRLRTRKTQRTSQRSEEYILFNKTGSQRQRTGQSLGKTLNLRSRKGQGTSQRPEERRLLGKTRSHGQRATKRPEQRSLLSKTRS